MKIFNFCENFQFLQFNKISVLHERVFVMYTTSIEYIFVAFYSSGKHVRAMNANLKVKLGYAEVYFFFFFFFDPKHIVWVLIL